ncbi:MAG: hypothetical protein AB2L14_21085 [Candidatus Xenobiia bacterium LiM19]
MMQTEKEDDLRDIAYAMFCCMNDEDSCDICKQELYWLPEMFPEPPYPKCKSERGRLCLPIYTDKVESGSEKIVKFLKQKGGKATSAEVSFWENEQNIKRNAKVNKELEKVKSINNKMQTAHEMEKENPNKALILYREAIEFYKEKAENSNEQYKWRSFPYHCYDRVSLILDRLKQYDDALSVIEEYEVIRSKNDYAPVYIKTIMNRKTRILGKLGIPSEPEKTTIRSAKIETPFERVPDTEKHISKNRTPWWKKLLGLK